MKFEGIKGEWRVMHSESKDAWNVVGTVLGGKYKIARCPYVDMEFIDVDKKEAWANAVLMSKAPVMLDMLNKIVDYSCEPNSPYNPTVFEAKELLMQIESIRYGK